MEYKLGKRIVEAITGSELVLEYFLLEKLDEESHQISYGAKIRKTEKDKEEIEIVEGITQSKEKMQELVLLLMNYTVTPISMVNVIDDYVTENVCS